METTRGDSERVTEVVARLRARGERVTPARHAVLRVIDAADDAGEHLTAEQIGARVADLEPAVHRATVYRTLTSLADADAVTHVHLGGSSTVYHLAAQADSDARGGEQPTPQPDHVHVQCVECGRVQDAAAHLLDDVAARLQRDLGFTLAQGHAALLGTCAECAQTARTSSR